MERTPEDRYTDLLRHLASPSLVAPDELAQCLREVEQMHSMGHITSLQVTKARNAYAATIEREPDQGPPTAAGALDAG